MILKGNCTPRFWFFDMLILYKQKTFTSLFYRCLKIFLDDITGFKSTIEWILSRYRLSASLSTSFSSIVQDNWAFEPSGIIKKSSLSVYKKKRDSGFELLLPKCPLQSIPLQIVKNRHSDLNDIWTIFDDFLWTNDR